MNQVPWKWVFLVGGIFVVVMNIVHFAVAKRDVSQCLEFESLKIAGVVDFSGRVKDFSGGKYGLLKIKTNIGLVKIDKGLDPVILASFKTGDSIRLIGNGSIVTPSGESYKLFRCRP
jgi:hypothetical protein